MGNNLTIDQINAPDFSGIGTLMAGANNSFNNAFEAAQGVLGKYQEGQQAKADAGYLNALGNITNEAELTSFFAKNPLAKANLSPDMMKTMLAMRDTVIGYGMDRATTDNTNAATDSTRSATNRENITFQDNVNRLAADRAAQPALTGAMAYGQENGQADWLTYKNQNATRNDPLNPSLVGAMGFLGDMGVRMEVVSGGQESNKPGEGTGSTRHNHGNSADADFYVGDHKLDPSIPEDRAKLATIATRAAENGLTGFGEGADYMGAGRMHLGYGTPGVWGAGGKGENAPAWLVDAVAAGAANRSRPDGQGGPVNSSAVTYSNPAPQGGPGGSTPGPGGYTGGNTNSWMQNPEFQKGVAAIQANKYLTTAEAQAQMNQLIAAFQGGQDSINARNTSTQATLAAAAQNAIALDPTINTDAARQTALAQTPGLDPLTIQTGAADLNTLTAPGGALGAAANPPVVIPPGGAIAAQAAQDRIDKSLATNPSTAATALVTPFAEASDPIAKLIEDTNAQVSFGMPSLGDDRATREALQNAARDARVTVPELAATLFDLTDRQGVDSSFWGTEPNAAMVLRDYRSGGKGAMTGVDLVAEAAKRYGPGANYDASTAAAGAANAKNDIDVVQAQIGSLSATVSKMRLQNPADPRIAPMESKIQSLTTQLNQIGSPTEELVGQLKTLPKGSPQFTEKANALIASMEQDSKFTQKDIDAARLQLGLPKP